MTDTDIVTRLAREADPDRHYPDAALFADDVAFLARFAALVAAECAKIADEYEYDVSAGHAIRERFKEPT